MLLTNFSMKISFTSKISSNLFSLKEEPFANTCICVYACASKYKFISKLYPGTDSAALR